MDAAPYRDWLVSLRRSLHRRPEPAWCEFYTTARIVEELKSIGVDELFIGPDAIDTSQRQAVPDEATIAEWFGRASETDADQSILDQLAGGYTGVVATITGGDGPTVALRVDIDGLPRAESTDESHVPAATGFRSVHDGHMHACGHDAHAAIGLGVARMAVENGFPGTLKILFQPAEEKIGGGRAMAASGHLDDVDGLIAVHVGLDHPTGEVVAGIDGFLAVSHVAATFHGAGAHAGGQPNRGRNAVQAMATAVQNLYGIARHEDGATRINAGDVGGGTAANVIPEQSYIAGEVRGETTALMRYTRDRADQVIEAAAAMHDCEVEIEHSSVAPSGTSDDAVREYITEAAHGHDRVESVRSRAELGGSEDATYLMEHVQDQGGIAGYVGIGTDHPGGHHTATFDVDEESLLIGVEVLAEALTVMARDGIETNGQSQDASEGPSTR